MLTTPRGVTMKKHFFWELKNPLKIRDASSGVNSSTGVLANSLKKTFNLKFELDKKYSWRFQKKTQSHLELHHCLYPFTKISPIYSAMKVNSLYLKNVSSWTVFSRTWFLSRSALLCCALRWNIKNVRFLLQRHFRLFFFLTMHIFVLSCKSLITTKQEKEKLSNTFSVDFEIGKRSIQ